MKKILLLIGIVVAGTYGVGWFNLSMPGAMRFINALEDLSVQGKAQQYCDRLHDDLTVSIDDRTGPQPILIEGGKQVYCDYVSMAAKGMSLLGVSMQVTRNDITVERSWLHPWTARVLYNEERTTTMSRVNATINTESDDRLTLVQTFQGVKLLKLEASSSLVP